MRVCVAVGGRSLGARGLCADPSSAHGGDGDSRTRHLGSSTKSRPTRRRTHNSALSGCAARVVPEGTARMQSTGHDSGRHMEADIGGRQRRYLLRSRCQERPEAAPVPTEQGSKPHGPRQPRCARSSRRYDLRCTADDCSNCTGRWTELGEMAVVRSPSKSAASVMYAHNVSRTRATCRLSSYSLLYSSSDFCHLTNLQSLHEFYLNRPRSALGTTEILYAMLQYAVLCTACTVGISPIVPIVSVVLYVLW